MGTRVILDWGSKRQTHVARPVAQAELQALVDGVSKSFLYIVMLMEELGVTIEPWVRTDSDAARLGLKQVRTSAMRTMKKTHRLNLAWVHELAYETQIINLDRVASQDNWANYLTKTDHPGEFERQMKMIKEA